MKGPMDNQSHRGDPRRKWQPPVFHHSDPEAAQAEPERVDSEAEYLQRLAQDQTPVVVHLRSGETVRGFIEYYDQRFIRLTRQGAPNLFIFKQDIKYVYEE